MIQKPCRNSQGFTLIELMVVITIIGILGAIAIPNFIAYRDKGFCSAAESDATAIANAISEYFAIPTVQTCSNAALLGTNASGKIYVRETFSNLNTWNLDATDLKHISITVTDAKRRCPNDYRVAMTAAISPSGYWSGFTYIKIVD